MIQLRNIAVFLIACQLTTTLQASESPDGVWSDVEETTLKELDTKQLSPYRYRTVRLDWPMLESILAWAPMEGSNASLAVETVLSLPLPDGTFGRFDIVESPIMEPGLATKFPEIQTYRGQGIDDPHATVRLDRTPAGFHAMMLSPQGSVYIDPRGRDDVDHYISYRARDARLGDRRFVCSVPHHDSPMTRHESAALPLASGTTLRTYRLAVAATGEYTAFHGGTVAAGQAAIVTAMNRVNGIYEREVAIRMVLVANNDQVVYTNGATDPYSNNSGGAMLSQNQSNLDAVIGNANYDIGHVFSTGGGGIASLGVPCLTGFKARGVTGLSNPTGDVFWVDFVSHEMGHQWDGNHTFNGTAGSCSGGNRNGSTAYEPGSGTTIQAYAGICGSQNIQNNSDDYFHGISLDQIIGYSTSGNGDNCDVATATGNNPPAVDAGAAYTIPLNTPFELCGSATDPDGDPLTYGWEEFDLGPAGAPNSPSGNAPIFRTFQPTPSPCRTFPQPSDLLNNTQTLGELLPTYARTMNFRLTARDNRSGGGGVNNDSTTVTVSDVGGPFQVTAPNTAVTWTGGTSETVTWNVANTTLAPISCASVDILLSTDGGNTFPTTLAAGVANDGSQSVTVPNTPTSTARIKVRCAGNIFFDVSNTDFTVLAGVCSADGFEADDSSGTAKALGFSTQERSLCPAGDDDWATFTLAEESQVVVETSGAAGDTVMTLYNGAVSMIEENDNGGAGSFSKIDRLCGADSLAAGTYFVRIQENGDNDEVGAYNLDLTALPCTCPDHLVLANTTISGPRTFIGNLTATLGPDLVVQGSDTEILAGQRVILTSGTWIQGGLRIGIDPNACPR